MASKLIVLVVAFSVLQFGQCEVHKRDIGSLVNSTITTFNNNILSPIEQRLGEGIKQAENLVKSVSDKAKEVIGEAVTTIEKYAQDFSKQIKSEVDKAVQLGKNVSSCISGQSEQAGNITKAAGASITACATEASKPASDLLADLTNLGGQIGAVAKTLPSQLSACASSGFFGAFGCVFGVASTAGGRANLYSSAILGDMVSIGEQGIQLPGKLAQCGSSGVGDAIKQFAALGATVTSCIQNGPPAAA